jgi:hypothetical protein
LKAPPLPCADVIDRLTALGVPTEKITHHGRRFKKPGVDEIAPISHGPENRSADHGDASALERAAIAAVAVGIYPDLRAPLRP